MLNLPVITLKTRRVAIFVTVDGWKQIPYRFCGYVYVCGLLHINIQITRRNVCCCFTFHKNETQNSCRPFEGLFPAIISGSHFRICTGVPPTPQVRTTTILVLLMCGGLYAHEDYTKYRHNLSAVSKFVGWEGYRHMNRRD